MNPIKLEPGTRITIEDGYLVIEQEKKPLHPEVGKWYWSEYHKKAFRFSENLAESEIADVNLDYIYKVDIGFYRAGYLQREATTSEIEATLIKVAKAKGYKEGGNC